MILDDIIALSPTEFRKRSVEAIEWFGTRLASLKTTPQSISEDVNNYTLPPLQRGHMYMYFYDAKLKDQLPYWDKFPVVVPIEIYETGFLGINFHYIPPRRRAELLSGLFRYFDEDGDSIDMTYRLLRKISKLKWAKPCLKQYLYNYIDGYISEIEPEYWEAIVMLRISQFNANANTVYADSSKVVING